MQAPPRKAASAWLLAQRAVTGADRRSARCCRLSRAGEGRSGRISRCAGTALSSGATNSSSRGTKHWYASDGGCSALFLQVRFVRYQFADLIGHQTDHHRVVHILQEADIKKLVDIALEAYPMDDIARRQ